MKTDEGKTEKGGNVMKKVNWKWIFPVVHMLIVSFYMVFGFSHDPLPFGMMAPANDVNWSEGCGKAAHIFLAGILGFCLICIVWYVFFLSVKKKKALPFVLAGIAFILSFIIFPRNFSWEPDNMVVYSYAVRDMPDYWQSIYLGCLYKACLFVFPHPLMISFIQLSSLFGVLYYVSAKVKKLFGGKAGFIPYLLVLFPEFLELGVSPYRNCIYTIMCLWFFAFLFFDCFEKRKRSAGEILLICAAGGLLTFFRSEGIIIPLVLMAGFCCIYQISFKRICTYLAFLILICLLLAFPQKLGAKKYYGQDYSIINSMNMLKAILSDKNVNLNYDMSEEDLMAIHKIVPLNELPVYGIHAYEAGNFVKKGTINQSLASKEESQAFIRSVRNLIVHNFDLFLKDRFVMFCKANGLVSVNEDPYPTEDWNRMYALLLAEWNYSYGEIIADSFPKEIFVNRTKLDLADVIADFQGDYYDFMCKSNLILISRILIFILFPVLVIYDIKVCAKKERTFWAASAFFLLVQLAAVILLCPQERNVYYFPSYFVMLLGCFLLSIDIVKKSKQVKAMLPPVTDKLNTMP